MVGVAGPYLNAVARVRPVTRRPQAVSTNEATKIRGSQEEIAATNGRRATVPLLFITRYRFLCTARNSNHCSSSRGGPKRLSDDVKSII